jgi:tagatose-6-phosphate ketose/aldose isomerase
MKAEPGYSHTLREICQQPVTWVNTAERMVANRVQLELFLSAFRTSDQGNSMVLTGSGSSFYVGECLSLTLQEEFGIPLLTIPSGLILTHSRSALPRSRHCLVVSFARSGDSPESNAVVDLLEGKYRHLIITCNSKGRLAVQQQANRRAYTLTLDDVTCDRSLVMTSSFTNMVLAGRALGKMDLIEEYQKATRQLVLVATRILREDAGQLSQAASQEFRSALYLGSGVRLGSARESALKMLEMTAGRVMAFAETYLGVRHGPLSAVQPDTLIVCFLSSTPEVRAYELDLIQELNRKGLGLQKVIVGERVPVCIVLERDCVIECSDGAALEDANFPVLDALVGQLLAFFRCRSLGLKPDCPSEQAIISRVVGGFPIYRTG